MRPLRSLILLSLSLLSAPAFADNLMKPGDECHLKAILDQIYRENIGLARDARDLQDVPKTYFFWGRLGQLIGATEPEKIQALFDTTQGGLSTTDIDRIWFAMESNRFDEMGIKLTEEERDFIRQLHLLTKDKRGAFVPRPNMAYYLLEGIKQEEEAQLYGQKLRSGAEFTNDSIEHTDRGILAQALAMVSGKKFPYPASRWYDPITRIWTSPYNNVKKILAFGAAERANLQLAAAADAPFEDLLKRYDGKLDQDAINAFTESVADTGAKVDATRDRMRAVYGREVSLKEPVKAGEIRIQEVAKRAEASGAPEKLAALERESEKDMDIIDDQMKRVLGHEFPATEMHQRQLEIRNPQYVRETGAHRSRYYSITHGQNPLNSTYTVKVQWEETYSYRRVVMEPKQVPVRNAKGEVTGHRTVMEPVTKHTSRSETRYHTYTVNANTEDVLKGTKISEEDHVAKTSKWELPEENPCPEIGGSPRWNCTGASQGERGYNDHNQKRVDEIFQSGASARAQEKPYRKLIGDLIDVADSVNTENYPSVRDNAQKRADVLKNFDQTYDRLVKARDEAQEYAKWDDGRIKGQWADDTGENFRERNRQMAVRYEHLRRRLELLREQVRRGVPSLEFQDIQPNYDTVISPLEADEARASMNRKITAGAGAVTAAAGAGGAYYYNENPEEAKAKVKSGWDRIKATFGF